MAGAEVQPCVGRGPTPWREGGLERFGNGGVRRRKGPSRGHLLGSCGLGGGELGAGVGRRREAGPGLAARSRRAGAAQWWAPRLAFRSEGC